ncbi:glycerophosphodiester phosphodiesterase family protein [Cellulomonas composti]|uniref:Glycerophosphoryl diester phosphodiesterase n=1 Tax=Cellulomonas composti TaxID=266130 RepID=A0A511J8R7_9CELL|nr:glycerophosphodiester phosphodiesterase family protein [Cellulomonas composti]GEL94390.1 glycerophosphoryl diester phosphodiesterase [Cellulomonas composti]
MRHPYFGEPGSVLALAHRGFSPTGLENTMAAFQAAIDLGFRYVETDAHGTCDGVAVALHDPTLDRTTDRTGAVAELRWTHVGRALVGGVEPVPRIEDVLGTWPDLRLNIDIKARSAIGPVAAAIERTTAHDRVCVTSFSAERRDATLARLSRPVATGAATAECGLFLAAGATGRLPARAARRVDAFQVPWRLRAGRDPRRPLVTEHHVSAAHRSGRLVHVWTVDDATTMRALLDRGVDGIISNRADLLRDVLVERGLWGV